MKLYYVGTIFGSAEPTPHKFEMNFYRYFNHNSISNNSEKLDKKTYGYIQRYMGAYLDLDTGIEDKLLINCLNKLQKYEFYRSYLVHDEIVFEIIEDESGMFYGKELITGLLFPLTREINETKMYYQSRSTGDHKLEKIDVYVDKNMERFAKIIKFKECASANYINSYLANNKKKEFIERITKYYNENVFNKEIIEKEKEPDLRQNEITKIMGTIELLLNSIKIINNNTYLEQKEKYDELFRDPDEKYLNASKFKYREPSKKDLLIFLSNLKVSLIICKNNCNNIKNLVIPESVTSIGTYALYCEALHVIYFDGTIAQWEAIEKGNSLYHMNTTEVVCTDGTVAL